jgi:hypothetical protein
MANNGVEYVLSLKDLFTSKIRGATQETEKLNSAVSKTQNAFSGMGSALAGLGLTIGVGALANEMLNVGSTFEQANIGLRTLLKSADEADKVFNQLKLDATTSPFDFETLLMGNKANNEPLKDTYQDIVNYGIIAQIVERGDWKK